MTLALPKKRLTTVLVSDQGFFPRLDQINALFDSELSAGHNAFLLNIVQ